MVHIRPFRGLRPVPELVEQVASPPYDVLNRQEAVEKAQGNPNSFLHIVRSEIDVDSSVGEHEDTVYQKGIDNLERFIREGILKQDINECLYIYRLKMGNHEQTGLVTTVAVQDYIEKRVKVHEYTRPDKEQDRANHIDRLDAQCGPVFLMAQSNLLAEMLNEAVQRSRKPIYNFKSDYDIQHTFYVIDNKDEIARYVDVFAGLQAVYVADGHHRSAAAARVCEKRRAENPSHTGNEEYNFFLTVIFPSSQLRVWDYNRVVRDLHGLSKDTLLDKISEKFDVVECSDDMCNEQCCYRPFKPTTYGMYVDGNWYLLTAKPGTFNTNDPIESLDIHILRNNLLTPVLGIGDSRTDTRINFVGGIRGLGELKRLVDSGEFAVAFSLFPTSVQQLIDVADAGEVMPAKSTWFEPKLRSGLVTHLLNNR